MTALQNKTPTVWQCGRFCFNWERDPTPIVMGILNITPDSFADGGRFLDPQRALEHAFQMIEDGAKIIDLGGESTRPGAQPISAQEEQDRIFPVLEQLQTAGVALSLDSYKGQTMQQALIVGIDIFNDISGFVDANNQEVAAASQNIGLCIMHMQKTPQVMQQEPQYTHVVQEVLQFLTQRVEHLSSLGIEPARLAIDPGFGFGKTAEHNLSLLNQLDTLQVLGTTILVGLSRKKTLAKIIGSSESGLINASVVAALLAVERGARVLRVHDVKPTVEALKVWTAVRLEGLQ